LITAVDVRLCEWDYDLKRVNSIIFTIHVSQKASASQSSFERGPASELAPRFTN
jgi:hypothetical protein